MNQEQNNLNQNNFNIQGNNGTPNNQPLQNNQSFNNTFNQSVAPNTNVNQPTFNPQPMVEPMQQPVQPQATPSYKRPIMQESTPQPANPVQSESTSNQNFNRKPPKKMNLGLIIGIVAVVAVIGVGALLLFNKPSSQTNNNGTTNIPIMNVDQPQYENNFLELMNGFEEKQGEIVDIVSAGNVTYFLTMNNEIYTELVNTYNYEFTLDSNFKEIEDEVMCNGDLVIKNKDNSYTIYDYGNFDKKFTFEQVNLVCAYINGGELSTITSENNSLYYNSYNENNGKLVPNKSKIVIDETNARLNNDSRIEYEGNIFRVYPMLESSLIATREDGLTYVVSLSAPSIENNKTIFYTNSNYRMIENVDSVYNTGSLIYYLAPFYTIKNNSTSVFVRKGSIISFDTINMPLPSGYITSDIKSLNASKEILLVTTDGNVFYKDEANSNQVWNNLSELSELIKNNHILKITNTSSEIIILTDDGYLYELN